MAKIGRLWRLPVFLICVVLLSTLATPAVGAAVDQPAGRIHPYLLNQAKEAPQAWVDVIVARRKGASEEAIEKASGGKRVKSWSFVNATQLRMPAAALERLAKLPGVAAIAPNAPMQPTLAYDQNAVMGNYQAALQIQPFWQTPYLGDGIGVAVIDSGVAPHPDLQSHTVNVVLPSVGDWQDAFGHGTHVAGIIAGDAGDGQRIGIAPHATIYNLRVTDNNGMSSESAVISALEWVYNNHQKYNIRVVNISMQSTVAGSYLDSPLSGAVEKLWFAGVVVVVSAGNRGDEESAAMYAPASDPYVITVGAADDAATKETGDDRFVFWSSRGLTLEGLPKPDILAPGRLIKSTLAPGSVLAAQYPAQVEGDYLTISGSSMAYRLSPGPWRRCFSSSRA